MAYPMMKGKHAERAAFSVEDFYRYRRRAGRILKEISVPESIIMCYSQRLSKRIESAHKISEIRGVFGNWAKLSLIEGTGGRVGMLSDFGIGAPVTVMYMEELLPWKVKRFAIIGTAGALNPRLKIGDAVVCTKSIRDEGTSHHYVKHGKYAYASERLTEKMYVSLSHEFKHLFKGASWTIDAPYRETVKELVRYRREGVLTVEMESSALFAVGELKGIESCAIFVVSDILSEKRWKPSFGSEVIMTNLLKAFRVMKETLSELS